MDVQNVRHNEKAADEKTADDTEPRNVQSHTGKSETEKHHERKSCSKDDVLPVNGAHSLGTGHNRLVWCRCHGNAGNTPDEKKVCDRPSQARLVRKHSA